jgi:hypothetical protein
MEATNDHHIGSLVCAVLTMIKVSIESSATALHNSEIKYVESSRVHNDI